MSDYAEIANAAERLAFLRLERWLREIFGRLRLTEDEQWIGTALITDLRIALGLPPLPGAPSAAAPPRTEAEVETRRFGEELPHLRIVDDPEAVEERETRELSTAEEICAGSMLGYGNNLK